MMYLPAGYVKIAGATVQRNDYIRLVNLANRYSLWTSDTVNNPAKFGIGNGTTTMVLPDWRGVVRRFLDDGKGYDDGRALGSFQGDDNKSHYHGYRTHYTPSGYDNTGGTFISGCDSGYNIGPVYNPNFIIPVGAVEARMKNIAEMAVMRY